MTKKQTTILSISTEPEFPDQLVWNLIKEDGNSITGIAPNLKLALEAITSTITKMSNFKDIIEPVSVSKCLPEPKDLHPTEGWAWFCNKSSDWRNLLPPTKDPSDPMYWFPYTHWLPYWAIPYVKNESH